MQFDPENIANGLLQAHASNTPYTAPSSALGRSLTLDEAYLVQRRFVALRSASEKIVGYKSAANALPLQQRLELTQPIVGALFASGLRTRNATVALTDFRGLLLETELGFRTARSIESPVKTLAELRNAVTTVTPMFELADPGFGRARMTGTDLVAGNSASAGFVCGAVHSVQSVDPNAARVRFVRDDALLHEAEGRDLAGDQWQALLWLVNSVLALGYAIEPGCLLMTGALGGAHPAQEGRYRAEFGVLGPIAIDVVQARTDSR